MENGIYLNFPGGQDQGGDDGSTPLKIVSFQPIENYPGQMCVPKAGTEGGSMSQMSIGSPVMMQNQASVNSYMRQPRPLVGGAGMSQSQSSMGPGYSYTTTPRTQMMNNNYRAGARPSNSTCGNYPQFQFQQSYAARRR